MAGPRFSDITELYGDSYQSDSLLEERRPTWEHFANVFSDWAIDHGIYLNGAPAARSLDVGCGAGPLVKAMRGRGWDSWGIEGSLRALEKSDELIIPWDLRVPLTVLEPFDLVTCFDVGEHVGNAEALVETCSAATSEWLLFGAAPPGQDGLGHIDCRDDWPQLFAKWGLSYEPGETEALKESIRVVEYHNKIWWIEKSLRAYRRA